MLRRDTDSEDDEILEYIDSDGYSFSCIGDEFRSNHSLTPGPVLPASSGQVSRRTPGAGDHPSVIRSDPKEYHHTGAFEHSLLHSPVIKYPGMNDSPVQAPEALQPIDRNSPRLHDPNSSLMRNDTLMDLDRFNFDSIAKAQIAMNSLAIDSSSQVVYQSTPVKMNQDQHDMNMSSGDIPQSMVNDVRALLFSPETVEKHNNSESNKSLSLPHSPFAGEALFEVSPGKNIHSRPFVPMGGSQSQTQTQYGSEDAGALPNHINSNNNQQPGTTKLMEERDTAISEDRIREGKSYFSKKEISGFNSDSYGNGASVSVSGTQRSTADDFHSNTRKFRYVDKVSIYAM